MALLKSRRAKWLTGTAFGLVVLLLVLAFVPGWYLRDALQAGLADQGLRAEGIDDVHFNLFSLSLETGPVEIWREDQPVVALSGLELFLRGGPLMQQRIDVDGAELRGLTLEISPDEDGVPTISGLPAFESGAGAEQGSNWLLGLSRLSLAQSVVTINLPQIKGTLTIDRLDLTSFKTWSPSAPGTLMLRARFAGADIAADAQIKPFGDDIEAEFDLRVGEFPLDRLTLETPVVGLLTADLKGRAETAEAPRLFVSGDLRLADMSADLDGIALTVGELTADLDSMDIGLAPDLSVLGNVALSLSGLEVVTTDEPEELIASLGRFTSHADVNLQNGDALSLQGRNDLSLRDIDVGLGGGGQLLQTNAVDVRDWRLDPEGGMSSARIDINGLRALVAEAEPLIRAETLVLAALTVTATGNIDLESLEIGGLVGAVSRDQDGFAGLDLIDRLPAGPEPDVSSAPAITIGSVTLSDPARIAFLDRSLLTPATQRMTISELTITDIRTADAGHFSQVTFDSLINDQAAVSLNGRVAPFQGMEPSFDLTGSVKNLELHNLSPYVAAALGVHMRSGRLDVGFTGTSDKGALEANGEWLIKKVEIEDLDAFEQSSLEAAADVPIETAINLLSDKQGTIELQVPIAGRLDDPEFDLSQAINKAISSAIGNAVETTLKVIFPVMLLADIGGSSSLKFDPVAFAPGDDQVSDGATDGLRTIADLLDARPKISITVCGVAADADFQALRAAAQLVPETGAPTAEEPEAGPVIEQPITAEERAALTDLAQRRTGAAGTALTDGLGADPARVFECRARVDLEEGLPRAEISI
ncbi:MAG: DUF748 domain-containing protein [Alphaproteobacteria bacterium]